MRRWILAVVIAVVVVVRARHHAPAENKAALAMAILKDVADLDGQGISWFTHTDDASATLTQLDRARFHDGGDRALIQSEGWKLELGMSKVFRVSCYVRGGDVGDYPEYGFISFMPEGGDVFDSLFDVGFDSGSIAALERICAKHGLRVER